MKLLSIIIQNQATFYGNGKGKSEPPFPCRTLYLEFHLGWLAIKDWHVNFKILHQAWSWVWPQGYHTKWSNVYSSEWIFRRTSISIHWVLHFRSPFRFNKFLWNIWETGKFLKTRIWKIAIRAKDISHNHSTKRKKEEESSQNLQKKLHISTYGGGIRIDLEDKLARNLRCKSEKRGWLQLHQENSPRPHPPPLSIYRTSTSSWEYLCCSNRMFLWRLHRWRIWRGFGVLRKHGSRRCPLMNRV